MPTINIPPVVRFALYLVGALSLLTVSYAVDKSWAGDAEVRFVTGLAALLQLLAAAKTNLHEAKVYELDAQVEHTGHVEGTVSPPAEHGATDAVTILAVVVLVLILLALLGYIR